MSVCALALMSAHHSGDVDDLRAQTLLLRLVVGGVDGLLELHDQCHVSAGDAVDASVQLARRAKRKSDRTLIVGGDLCGGIV